MSGHPRNGDVWRAVTDTKGAVLGLLHAPNDGIRTLALKFIQKLVYCFTEAPTVRVLALPSPTEDALRSRRSAHMRTCRSWRARAWTWRVPCRSTLCRTATRSSTAANCWPKAKVT
jgi:hypothetical protein